MGPRAPHRPAVQPAPGRPHGRGRLRHARQDLQGHDRRDAGLADRAAARPRRRGTDLGVVVRPELVVEIAYDGLQRSTRYPAGVTLRFARVVRYREDKRPEEADTVETLLAAHPGVQP
ncbi:hypothetical protein ACFQ1B_06860 [Streptomyces mexicanus]